MKVSSLNDMPEIFRFRKYNIKMYNVKVIYEYGVIKSSDELSFLTFKYNEANKKWNEYVNMIEQEKDALGVFDILIDDAKKELKELKEKYNIK